MAAIPTEIPIPSSRGQSSRAPFQRTWIVRIATSARPPWTMKVMTTKATAKATMPPPLAAIATTEPVQRTLLRVVKATVTWLRTWRRKTIRRVERTEARKPSERTRPVTHICWSEATSASTATKTTSAGTEIARRRLAAAPTQAPSRSGSWVASRIATVSSPRLPTIATRSITARIVAHSP